MPRTSGAFRGRGSWPLAGALIVVVGCLSTTPPPQTGVGRALGVQVTSRRARIGSFNAAGGIMASIEVTADSIAALSSDAGAQRRALEWKTYGIPAVQRAMFHPDPFVSYLDGWSFVIQMRHYFEDGGGRAFFGPHQRLAIETCERVQRALEAGIPGLVGEATYHDLLGRVTSWAAEHPLDNHLYLRRSMSEAAADLLAERGAGGLAALGTVQDLAQDAQQTALILASYVPKSVAWQSELLLSDLADTSRVAPLLDAVDQMELSTAASRFLNRMPELITTERVALLRAVSEERARLIADVNATSMQTLESVFALERAERDIILAEVSRLIAGERAVVLAAVDSLHARTFAEARGMVDHVIVRVVQLVLGTVVLVALLAVPALRVWKRANS